MKALVHLIIVENVQRLQKYPAILNSHLNNIQMQYNIDYTTPNKMHYNMHVIRRPAPKSTVYGANYYSYY